MKQQSSVTERGIHQFGGTHFGVWVIKHLVSPLDKLIFRLTKGRRVLLGRPLAPMLLLTTRGRHSGKDRTTPIFYLQESDQLIICNVNPGFERPNPWTLNLRANPQAVVQIGAETKYCTAREAAEQEIEHYWPQLVAIWPAYQTHYEHSGQRSIFILSPAEK